MTVLTIVNLIALVCAVLGYACAKDWYTSAKAGSEGSLLVLAVVTGMSVTSGLMRVAAEVVQWWTP